MENQKKLALIATKGTLDWAYPPFILTSTAAALGYQVQIFFTFYGLNLLKRKMNLKISPLGNPGMPMPMGMDKWFPTLGTALPGMEGMMTGMMKRKMKSKGIASVQELRDLCIEADVELTHGHSDNRTFERYLGFEDFTFYAIDVLEVLAGGAGIRRRSFLGQYKRSRDHEVDDACGNRNISFLGPAP